MPSNETRSKFTYTEDKSAKSSKRYKYDVETKLADMSPMNLFYSKVKDSPETHGDGRSLYFADLLHPSLGKLKESLQVTNRVDFSWLMTNYEITDNETKPLIILYGEESPELAGTKKPRSNVTAHLINSTNVSHQAKMMVLVYDDDSIRVVVHTANLTLLAWENRTQGLWVSPKCPMMSPNSDNSMSDNLYGDSQTQFKRALLRYLDSYGIPDLSSITNTIKKCDLSAVNAFFVASVPGSHPLKDLKDPLDTWGHVLVGKILRRHNEDTKDLYAVVVQCSFDEITSIDEPYLEELVRSFNVTNDIKAPKLPDSVKIIRPALEDYTYSYEELNEDVKSTLSFNQIEHPKWLRNQLYRWKSDDLHRTFAIPQIKSYTRFNGYSNSKNKDILSQARASYLLMSSASVSKESWGYIEQRCQLVIKSYEVGVLLLPKFTHGPSNTSYSIITSDVEGAKKLPELTLPYDLPLIKH